MQVMFRKNLGLSNLKDEVENFYSECKTASDKAKSLLVEFVSALEWDNDIRTKIQKLYEYCDYLKEFIVLPIRKYRTVRFVLDCEVDMSYLNEAMKVFNYFEYKLEQAMEIGYFSDWKYLFSGLLKDPEDISIVDAIVNKSLDTICLKRISKNE